ncbi:MAG: flgI [Magnetococcales bacterium]|nr:flgI [Magnetococcales bacterium]HIJ83498.1 flagellar basal body P-ring protein FlgI [Magnetococcales bacterium]
MNPQFASCLLLVLLVQFSGWSTAEAARLKDIVSIEGVRDNPLTGYGLVVGLGGTGDKNLTARKSIENLLQHLDISAIGPSSKNSAAVLVTATVPPFARQGSQLDVTISSIGDAGSLQGGTLVMTPLKGADGRIYAVAQGPIALGGFSAVGNDQSKQQKNHTTVARISGGATVEREIPFELNKENSLQLTLKNPDFTTANRVVDSINEKLGGLNASARDSGTIALVVPPAYRGRIVSLVSQLEALQVEPDQPAKVVVNERTGTIVMGENVRVSTVALAHGNLSIKITEDFNVSQPNPLSLGVTVVTPDSQVSAKEENAQVVQMNEGVTLGDLVRNLNKIGVTPRDLITILQSIKAAGALQAELEIL